MNRTLTILSLTVAAALGGGCKNSGGDGMPNGKKFDAAGVWIMDDTQKMAAAVASDKKQKGQYCLDFQPAKNKAIVQFLFSDQKYDLDVVKVDADHYKIGKPENARAAFIKFEAAEPNLYWYFDDSSPYSTDKTSSYDGIREPNYRSIEDCIAHGQQDYEFVHQSEKSDLDGTAEDHSNTSSD